ncbi:MAG: glycogen synthase [Clostridia bacterium]|nr:glycogen synthase [Clostridia bacterium]
MKILYVGSEALPFISTGGLADVLGSLPAAVRRATDGDADVRVVIPLFPKIKENMDDSFELVSEGEVYLSWRKLYCAIWKTERDGVTVYFIDNEYYFNRPSLYGSFDDAERFAFFGKAVMYLMMNTGFVPDIMHANDWQSAPAVLYLKRQMCHIETYRYVKVLFTIHNIEYQGKYDMAILKDVFDLDGDDRSIVEYDGCINLLKGAITVADMVSTVSERYSCELMTEYYAAGLHGILRDSKDKLTGITNGIDVDYYDPTTDPDIKANYTPTKIAGKADDKADLREICGLEGDPKAPLMVMVSRLAGHKGFELVRRVMYDLLEQTNLTFAILGTGEAEYEEFFKKAQADYPGRVCIKLEYNKALSKKFYAGGDMFLMPSKSEPCGLSQMIASRYGTVPIVRETGGLYDTIKPFNEFTGEGNGFSFTNYNAHDMMAVIKYAIEVYNKKQKWAALRRKVMKVDFSWTASAKKYVKLYEDMLNS